MFKPKAKLLGVFAAKNEANDFAEEQAKADTDPGQDRYVVFVQKIR
jgi:hypothetical protein